VLALAVIPRLGTIVQAVVTIMGLFGGPLLGVFLLGALTRRPDGRSALIGAALGAATGALVAFSRPIFGVELSFMWISFAATAVTFIAGWLAGLACPSRPMESSSTRETQHA
jgi:sodium-coupled monocarboxylate transporter 8/12